MSQDYSSDVDAEKKQSIKAEDEQKKKNWQM